ncbi:hypothetical protein FIBSPDRAFT_868484 [Athelia psychrophila]|uniref:Uncharacterized protein n=1 Tax=Athelia psychrophila TaxID=1759441 RepID=A0A166D2W1_9AGAM|nr:hypothetical protein FIBSPDRAFT_877186 [Fibularhizoctonia sp. CBS 109695]KZP14255.1 hypothetical protein FIBSPDRAFT_868484 [Fibularhizoctonia sp. CBS 109695]
MGMLRIAGEGAGSGSELQAISDKTRAFYKKLPEYAVDCMTELSTAIQLGATRLRAKSQGTLNDANEVQNKSQLPGTRLERPSVRVN